MSDLDESARRNELDEFLERVENIMRNEFPSLAEEEAGIEIIVPEDSLQVRSSKRFGFEAAGGCNCPAGTRCFRFGRSGRRVCVSF